MMVCGTGTALIPFCFSLPLLGACVFFQGFAMGILDTGGNGS